jgi:dihydrodipicolinate synthase/N-acetylneuraminate lyase
MPNIQWHGVFPALTTKFTAADALDWAAMEKHLEFQLEAGVHGLIILGSLGENATLSAEEKREMVRFFARADRRGKPLVACIAESSTREARDFARAAEEAGADGFMLLPPMRYTGDRRETLAYLQDVAGATSLPIMLYNNPIAYGTDVLPEQVVAYAERHANLRAVKESSGDVRRITAIGALAGERLAVFVGLDDLIVEGVAAGAVGWIAGLVNALPAESVRLYELAREGRRQEAEELYGWFLPLLRLDTVPKFVQLIKMVQHVVDMGSERVRPPRLTLTGEEREHALQVIHHAIGTRPEF